MATFVRALVMLSVLVGLPAAWVYYGPLPPQAQQAVDRLVAMAKGAVGWNQATAGAAVESANSNRLPAAPAFTERQAAPALIRPKAATFADRVEPMLAELRQLGVMEYALERWGAGGELYRFRCEMPLGAQAELTQLFEAVAADPQLSVEQVVAEVSQWQLAQRAGM